MMLDLKALHQTLDLIESEKGIARETILEAIEMSLAAAYKKDYGKRGQIVRCSFNSETGDMTFYQAKEVVDETVVKPALTEEEVEMVKNGEMEEDETDERVRFNGEHHMMIENARLVKNSVEIGDEMVFPLDDPEEDFGRIAAQTAKQVIIQRLREAQKQLVLEDFAGREGEIITGIVQKVSRGTVYLDLGQATGIIPPQEKIPGEFYKTGERLKAYLYEVEDGKRGISIKLSRSHPGFIRELFAMESPEVEAGVVEIKSIQREPGSRTKMSVWSHDANVDPIGACVGQKGIRVATVIAEMGDREKIDIVPWSEDPAELVSNALSPARVLDVEINEEEHIAYVDVADDQLSLAIGKEGQNVRLAAKLTGWKIDIAGVEGAGMEENVYSEEGVKDSAESGVSSLAAAIASAREDAEQDEEFTMNGSEEEVEESGEESIEETLEEVVEETQEESEE